MHDTLNTRTIKRAALVALVRLLHHHDVHRTSQVGRDGVHTAQQRAASVEDRALCVCVVGDKATQRKFAFIQCE